ncbi:glutamate 5-kinase [Pleionea sp. CnH1-48]|uniref:glutamate 5-kinase n=1 Tax=Pleionea sp. CnH1-48 TaxID=2954494 RepID=UPI002097C87E|nr:glutamate 5-kinase [Pleionea sp. CnH1-48]
MGNKQRVVIKVGSQLFCHQDTEAIQQIAKQIAKLQQRGTQVILVSSGAVACGQARLSETELNREHEMHRQVFAAVGQDTIMGHWKQYLQQPLAQVLIDREHFDRREAYVKTQALIETMLEHSIIPIVNENDAVNKGSKVVGNNDNLAAFIAAMSNAQGLIFITNVAAIYKDYPHCQQAVTEMDAHDESLTQWLSAECSAMGTGGMKTKVEAARSVARRGIGTLITDEKTELWSRLKGFHHTGTLLTPGNKVLPGYRYWLSETSRSLGKVFVDDGARQALTQHGASLLLPGVRSCEGSFGTADIVDVCAQPSGQVIARGKIRVASNTLSQWLALSKTDLSLQHNQKSQIIVHRNDLVIVEGS